MKRKKSIKKASFTDAEKKLLSGLSGKLGRKHGCSSMYVRHIIKGDRDASSVLAQKIVKDLNTLLKFLSPKM